MDNANHSVVRSLAGALFALALAACSGSQQQLRAPVPAGADTAAAIDGAAAPAQTDAGSLGEADAMPMPPADPTSDLTAEDDDAGHTPDEPASGDNPTQAELDYAAIYGPAPYDPIADSSLPPAASIPDSFDPWEPFNRRVHSFNNVVDRAVAKPLATAYIKAVPRPVRLGVGNFFSNLGQPVSALNALLQGKPRQAAQAMGRFLLNATLGIGGIFDPASDADIPLRSKDFGQTLGVWGWENSRYLVLPLFGPRTVRDTVGLAGDAPLAPTRQIDDDRTRWFLQGLQLVDVRTQLMAVDRMREGAADDYALVRDAWMQRRSWQIRDNRRHDDDEAPLPDYLLDDETNPTVPVDAMPVIPPRG